MLPDSWYSRGSWFSRVIMISLCKGSQRPGDPCLVPDNPLLYCNSNSREQSCSIRREPRQIISLSPFLLSHGSDHFFRLPLYDVDARVDKGNTEGQRRRQFDFELCMQAGSWMVAHQQYKA